MNVGTDDTGWVGGWFIVTCYGWTGCSCFVACDWGISVGVAPLSFSLMLRSLIVDVDLWPRRPQARWDSARYRLR